MMHNKSFHAHVLMMIVITMLMIPSALADEGMTIKGISYVPFSSNNANMSGDKVIINLMLNGGASEVYGQWTGAGLPDGKKLEQPLKIVIRNNTEQLNYPFINQNALYKYHAYYIDSYGGESAQCPAKPAFCYPVMIDSLYTWNHRIVSIMINRLMVVERQAIGSYSAFGNPDISQTIELMITIKGTEYIHSIGTGQFAIGAATFKTAENEPIGNAIYTGMSMTGRGTPNHNLYVGTHLTNGQWHIAPKTSYESYVKSLTEIDIKLAGLQSELPDGFDRKGSLLPGGEIKSTACKDSICSDVVTLVNLHNAIVDNLTSQNVQINYNAPTSTQNTLSVNGAIFNTLNRPIGNGEVVLTLNAEKIGVVQNSGIPHIENVSLSSCISADNDCYFLITVQNIGEVKSTFGVRVNGSVEQKITLDVGASSDVEMPFVGTEGINTGSIEVYDLTSGESTIKTYQVNVSAPKRFIPNSTEIYNDVEIKTDSTGMNQTIGSECDGIWTSNNTTGKYHCIEFKDIAEPTPQQREQIILGVPTQTPAPPQESGLGLLGYGAIALILLMFGVIIGLSNRGGKKNSQSVVWLLILAIIFGAIIITVALYYRTAIEEMINNLILIIKINKMLATG